MTDKEFYEVAREHGFKPDQARFLVEFVSHRPHTHTADQIEDLDEAVTDIVEDLEDDANA